VFDPHERDPVELSGDLMNMDERLRANEGKSDSGAEASDDEIGRLPITPENFEISADRVPGTITIRPKKQSENRWGEGKAWGDPRGRRATVVRAAHWREANPRKDWHCRIPAAIRVTLSL
jgi:hypothetical protein